jgi:hypothetical protein
MMQNARINSPKLKLLLVLEQVSELTISYINELMVDKKKYGHSIINLCMFLSCKRFINNHQAYDDTYQEALAISLYHLNQNNHCRLDN